MISVETIRRRVLWTLLAVSAFASIEPSPYEFMFLCLVFVYARRGLVFDKTMTPMILALAAYNAGGLVALAPYATESRSVSYTITSLYVSLTAIVIASVVCAAPLQRMATIRSGYVFAALVSSALGAVGYFNIAGLGPYFTLYDNTRAMGAFKDPNVYGPFLVAPIIWLTRDLISRRGAAWSTLAQLAPLFVGLGLSFSRGAVIDALFGLALLFALSFVTAATASERGRVAWVAIASGGLLATIVAIAFAIPSLRAMILERSSLLQDYDVGVSGRFGNQLRSIPLLLGRPLGFGPLRFDQFFPEDPHEAFLSAFASNGWVGGLAFLAFVGVTIYLGWALALRRSPLQGEAIAVWAACFPQILQGVQIDTEHWRHLFLLIGCVYGLAAADRRMRVSDQPTNRSVTPNASRAAISSAPPAWT